MQSETTRLKTGAAYQRTDTPNIFRHANRYVAQWSENGRRLRRSFPTYEAACAFRRDYVLPHRERRGLPPSTIAPGPRGNKWLYVFESASVGEPVKIGCSSDPARRLRDIGAAHPHGLHLVLLVPGSRALERRVHELLADFRLQGEWFSHEALSKLTASLWAGVHGE